MNAYEKLDQIKKIHVVPYYHHDHAWTNTRDWHIWRYLEGYCAALDRMKEDEEYRLTIDNVLHSLEVFQKYCPHRMDEFRRRIAEGRIEVVNGGMALMRPSLFDGELYLRNIQCGQQELAKRLGTTPSPVFFNADTAVGHSQMPQILKLAGHEYYRFYRPEAALDDAKVPRECYWKGLDQTEILTSRGLYGGCLYAKWSEASFDEWDAVKQAFVEEDLQDKLALCSTDELLLNLGLDDALPQRNLYDKELDIPGLMTNWNENEKSRMEYSSFKEFFLSLKDKTIPVWDGPLDPCELSYNPPMRADHALWRKRVQGERLMVLLEKLLLLLEKMGGDVDYREIPSLWCRLMEYGGHAMQWLLSQDYREVEERANLALALIREKIADVTDKIAARTKQEAKVQYVAINTCSFARTENVTLHITSPYHVNGLRLRDSANNEIPYQIVETYNGDKAYSDRDYNEVKVTCNIQIPAFGYTCVFTEFDRKSICTAAEEQLAGCSDQYFEIDNGVYLLEVIQGAVRKLTRKSDGLVLFESPRNLFGAVRLYHTSPTNAWTVNYDELAIDTFVPEQVCRNENGPVRYSFVCIGKIGRHPARLETMLVHGSNRITYRLTIDNQGAEGYFCASFPCDCKPEIRAGIPFGEEVRNTEQIHYGKFSKNAFGDGLYVERGWDGGFYANGYASFSNNNAKMTLLQGDCNVYYRNKSESAEIELMLMRSFSQESRSEGWMSKVDAGFFGKGKQTFEYAITTTASPHVEVMRYRQPIQIATRFAYYDGEQPVEQSWMDLSGSALLLSAAYRNQDTIHLRFYDTAGQPGRVQIHTRMAHKTATVIDLCGNKLRELNTDGETIELAYRAWEICTIELR